MFFRMTLAWCRAARLFPRDMNPWTYWFYIRALDDLRGSFPKMIWPKEDPTMFDRRAQGLWWDIGLDLVTGCTPVSPGWDFDSLILDYLEEAQRKFQPKTWKYKAFVYQSFRDFAGNLPLSQINEHLVGKYLLTRPSNYNYNFHRKDLAALFRWAIHRGLMASQSLQRIPLVPIASSRPDSYYPGRVAPFSPGFRCGPGLFSDGLLYPRAGGRNLAAEMG